MLKIVVVEVNKKPYVKEIEDTLEAKQAVVGGYLEGIRMPDNFWIMVNEEGKMQGLEENRMIRGGLNQMLVGTFFITKVDPNTGDAVSLTDQDVEAVIPVFTPLVIE